MSPSPLSAALLGRLRQEVSDGIPRAAVFATLAEAMGELVGYKVLTVLAIDPVSLRSVRLYSSEPSYPVGGVKQHVKSAWSEAVFEERTFFLAPGLTELRQIFPDSAAIEAVGCGSVLAVPILLGERVLGTMNLWHQDGFYDRRKGETALPFAAAIAPVCTPPDSAP